MKRSPREASLESQSSDTRDDTDADADFNPSASNMRRRKTLNRSSAAHVQTRRQSAISARNATAATTAPTAAITSIPSNALTPATAGSSPLGTGIGKAAEFKDGTDVRAHLPACKLGAVEALTFFPNHLKWPELCMRLFRNDWTYLDVALTELHARNKLDPQSTEVVERRRGTLRKQVPTCGKDFFNDPSFKLSTSRSMNPVATYDASHYAPHNAARTNSLYHEKLVNMAKGVKNWSIGKDFGVVSKAILYAVRREQDHLTTADIPTLIHKQRFRDPQESFGPDWDKNAIDRIRARIELTANYRASHFEKAYEDDGEDESEDEKEESEEDELVAQAPARENRYD